MRVKLSKKTHDSTNVLHHCGSCYMYVYIVRCKLITNITEDVNTVLLASSGVGRVGYRVTEKFPTDNSDSVSSAVPMLSMK